MNRVTEQNTCRICGSKFLETVVDLGNIFPSGFVPEDFIPEESMKAPLVLVRCKDCGLVQLKHTVELDLMYRQYWYSPSLNKSMVSSLKDVVDDIESQIEILEGEVILDIGCNDGVMFNFFKYMGGIITVGVDPARNINKPKCSVFINDYFSAEKYMEVVNQKAKVITAIAMFYDLPNPVKFVSDVVDILHPNGKFVIQLTDLCSMLKVNAFDNICHEHLEYYSFEIVKNLLESLGLEVISVSHNDVNGASIRIISAFPGKYTVDDSVRVELLEERAYLSTNPFEEFNKSIGVTKRKIKGFLKWAKEGKHTTFILGASTKGNTLLQVCGITNEDCEFALEVNKDKFGLYTLGSGIKIISEESALAKHPEYFLVLPWHFKKNFISRELIQDFLNSNGSLVFPLPKLHVTTETGDFYL